MRTNPTAMRRCAADVQRSSSAPMGTPIAPPTRKGSKRPSLSARRSCHTEKPCTRRPKATMSAVVCTGVRICSHTAAATRPKAKPASPATSDAAKLATAKMSRSTGEVPSMCLSSPDRKAEGQSGPHFVERAVVHAGAAQGGVEGEISPHPPDRADQARSDGRVAEVALVEHFRDRPHRPILRSLDDGADEQIAMLLPRHRGDGVEVKREPRPLLRDDAGQAAPDPRP